MLGFMISVTKSLNLYAFLSSPKGVNNDNESGVNVIRTVDGEEDYPTMPICPDYGMCKRL